MDLVHTYATTIVALGALAVLMLCQLLVADVIGIRAKHVPGSQIPTDHKNLLFRASRAVANTNESIAVFILAVLFCILSGAPASTAGVSAWGFVIARALYSACYYLNWQAARSVMFGLSLVAIVSLLVCGGAVWF